MNRWVSRGCRSVALLVILLPCLVFLFACGGGDDSKNATITGTVSGTRVTVFDQNNIQAASVVASGNPKSFSVSLPAGTYRFLSYRE
jgi:hypothetical protein